MHDRIVITGASQGIGASTARAFASDGARKLVLVARNADKLEQVAFDCRALGADVCVIPCDVTRGSSVAAMAKSALGEGVPTAVINNAGAFTPGSLADTSEDDFAAMLSVNLTSAFLVTKAFLPSMIDAGSGHLFYMGSVASVKGYPGGVGYCAAKHGLLGLARVVREETKGHGIRVTTLLPGATLTPSWDGVDIPAERFMPSEDIAAAVVGAYRLSGRSVIEELLIRPQEGDL